MPNGPDEQLDMSDMGDADLMMAHVCKTGLVKPYPYIACSWCTPATTGWSIMMSPVEIDQHNARLQYARSRLVRMREEFEQQRREEEER